MVKALLGSQLDIEVRLTIEADTLMRVSLFSSRGFSVTADRTSPMFEKAVDWLDHYLHGKNLPFDLPTPQTGFTADVLRFLRTTLRGSVFSYQQVAEAVGNKKAARAVGNICRTNPFPLFIPCHRVIKANGEIGRYTPNLSFKSQLLHFEEVTASCATANYST